MLDLSVVLPTYNRIDRLKKVIRALERQTLPLDRFEVIVVSDGSKDGSNEYLSSYDGPLNISPILQENQGVAAARNNGYRAASGPIIVFIDDDVVPAPDLLETHLAHHINETGPPRLIVMGPMLSPDPEDFDMQPWVEYEQAMLVKQYNSMARGDWAPTARQFYTGNASIARSLLVQSGGFDPAFRRAEDVELAYRLADLGAEFVFDANAIGYHYAERSFKSWTNIAKSYGRNDVIFGQDKDQKWILEKVFLEFFNRNVLIQMLTKVSLGRPAIINISTQILKFMASVLHKANSQRLYQACYSGIFNITYYNGVATELGGRDLFLERLGHRSS